MSEDRGEDRVRNLLGRFGMGGFEEELPLGSWQLEFAFVRSRVDVEVDRFSHRNNDQLERDRLRDAQLVEWGWKVVRIDSDKDIAPQMADVALAIRANGGRAPLREIETHLQNLAPLDIGDGG